MHAYGGAFTLSYMIKINVVAVGKVKENYFASGIDEYSKRLNRFCEFKIIEVQEENFVKVDDGIISQIKEREADRILPHLKGQVFVLDINGKKYSSISFSNVIKNTVDSGGSVITFVIGGSYGLSDRVKNKANSRISFSDMTFPHTLFRLMLTEQIYRAFCILNNSPYHK